MAYPVLHKAGRQLSLSFDFTNDSSFWYPLTLQGGSVVWNPVQTGGWSGSPQGVGILIPNCSSDGFNIVCGPFVYYDSAGTAHPFSGVAVFESCCGDFPLTSITTDGSGYTLYADACFVKNGQCNVLVNLTSADGDGIIPQNGIPLNPTATAGSIIDRNGNEITTDASGNVTDTLGPQGGLATLRASGGNGQPYVMAYTSPAGTSANTTVSFQFPQVRTNFGCPASPNTVAPTAFKPVWSTRSRCPTVRSIGSHTRSHPATHTPPTTLLVASRPSRSPPAE